MVAISLLQPDPDDWCAAPLEGPLVESRRHRPPARSPARPLPDRATRWRRRRLAVLVAGGLLVAAVVAVAGQAVAPSASPGGQAGSPTAGPGEPAWRATPPPVEGEVYVVQPGDTLWTVAAAVAPDRDPRPVVDRLLAVNGGAQLDVGDRLIIDLG